jgi:hypothetical protein
MRAAPVCVFAPEESSPPKLCAGKTPGMVECLGNHERYLHRNWMMQRGGISFDIEFATKLADKPLHQLRARRSPMYSLQIETWSAISCAKYE